MENAKDTFYITLRDRLAALNPNRTFVLRGVTRPGVMVVDNELVTAELPADVFLLRWSDLKVDTTTAMPLATIGCEIQYFTDGTIDNGSMDRGHALTTMDEELRALLTPASAGKKSYLSFPATALQSAIFWSDPVFESVVRDAERVLRSVRVEVYSYEEPGE